MYQALPKVRMALDPSEIEYMMRKDNPSDEADLSELEDERGYSESESEEDAQVVDQGSLPETAESNELVSRWCREQFKEHDKASVSRASTRKRKLASSQESPTPPKHGRKSGNNERGETDFQEVKYLLQKLCKKVEKNEKYLKEIQQKDKRLDC